MAADLENLRRLVAAEHGLAVVATTRSDGSVHASVVNAGVLDDPRSGEPVVGLIARGDAVKVRLVRRAGRASLTFRVGWEWAAVEGPVQLIGPDDPADGFSPHRLPQLLRDVFSAAGGNHGDWNEYDRVMAAERRVAILVQPARMTSNA
ncbi:MAG: pyridoxamine 5'-phosphate oxidase family protein [Ilumatobacteraceae bacterium]